MPRSLLLAVLLVLAAGCAIPMPVEPDPGEAPAPTEETGPPPPVPAGNEPSPAPPPGDDTPAWTDRVTIDGPLPGDLDAASLATAIEALLPEERTDQTATRWTVIVTRFGYVQEVGVTMMDTGTDLVHWRARGLTRASQPGGDPTAPVLALVGEILHRASGRPPGRPWPASLLSLPPRPLGPVPPETLGGFDIGLMEALLLRDDVVAFDAAGRSAYAAHRGRPSLRPLRPSAALAVARDLALDQLVHTSITAAGGRLHLEVQRLDVRTGVTLGLYLGTLAPDTDLGVLAPAVAGALFAPLQGTATPPPDGAPPDGTSPPPTADFEPLKLLPVTLEVGGIQAFTGPGAPGSLAAGGRPPILIMGETDGHLGIWDATSGRLLRRNPGHAGPVRWVGAAGDRPTLLSTSWQEVLRWSLETDTPESIPEAHPPVALSPDGGWFAYRTGETTIRIHPLAGDPVELGVPSAPRALAALGTDHLVVGTANGIRPYDLGEVPPAPRPPFSYPGGAIELLAADPEGRRLAAVNGLAKTFVWDPLDGPARPLPIDGGPVSLLFLPDGRHLVTGMLDGRVIVWDTGAGLVVATTRVGEGPVTGLACWGRAPVLLTLCEGRFGLWSVER